MSHAALAALFASRLKWKADEDRARYEAALLTALDDGRFNKCACSGGPA